MAKTGKWCAQRAP